MRPWHIRTQQEILDRIHDAIDRGDQGDEFNEYMRCAKYIPLVLRGVYEDTTACDWEDFDHPGEVTCDDARSIDEIARALLPHFEYALRRAAQGHRRQSRLRTLMNQYRAWKWLLGHSDADTFLMQRTPLQVYRYLLNQIATGEWSNMFGEVKKKGKHATITTSSVNAQAIARATALAHP